MSDPVRHGFARVIDHSAEADEVTVAVIDDAGMRAGPVEVCGVNDEGDGAWSTGGCGITSTTSATGAPTISGTAQAGEEPTAGKGTITDTDGTTKADNGDTGFADTYQCAREDADGTNPADISGTTSGTHTLTADDVGKKIKVKVSFTDGGGTDEGPLTSAAYPTGGSVLAAGICGRTQQVRDAILGRISGINDCADVTDAHLATITGQLRFQYRGITTLQPGDFDGLTALEGLVLSDNDLTELPDGVFEDLIALEELNLDSNELAELPDGVFDGLTG